MAPTTQAEIRDMKERIYRLLSGGYAHLYNAARGKAHWEEARSTALAAMCLALKEPADSRWLPEVRKWILNEQISADEISAGSWGEEIWDTAMCTVALLDTGLEPESEPVAKALDWIDGVFQLNPRGSCHDEPWETSWALVALLASRYRPSHVNISLTLHWLVALQDSSGRIVAPHYTAYLLWINRRLQYSHRSLVDTDTIQLMAAAADRAASYLSAQLEACSPKDLWTNEGWSNGQILWAMAESGVFPIKNLDLLDKTLSWFENSRGEDGNWSDIEDTASALLGLAHLLEHLARSSGESRSLKELMVRVRDDAPSPPVLLRHISVERIGGVGRILFVSDTLVTRVTLIISGVGVVLATWHFMEEIRAAIEKLISLVF